MWIVVGLVALAACEKPGYDLTLRNGIRDGTGLEVFVDGEPAELTGDAVGSVHFRIERRYESYTAALDAVPIRFEVRREGPTRAVGANDAIVQRSGPSAADARGQLGGASAGHGHYHLDTCAAARVGSAAAAR